MRRPGSERSTVAIIRAGQRDLARDTWTELTGIVHRSRGRGLPTRAAARNASVTPWGGSSAGQSMGLIIPGSWVRAPPAPPGPDLQFLPPQVGRSVLSLAYGGHAAPARQRARRPPAHALGHRRVDLLGDRRGRVAGDLRRQAGPEPLRTVGVPRPGPAFRVSDASVPWTSRSGSRRTTGRWLPNSWDRGIGRTHVGAG